MPRIQTRPSSRSYVLVEVSIVNVERRNGRARRLIGQLTELDSGLKGRMYTSHLFCGPQRSRRRHALVVVE